MRVLSREYIIVGSKTFDLVFVIDRTLVSIDGVKKPTSRNFDPFFTFRLLKRI